MVTLLDLEKNFQDSLKLDDDKDELDNEDNICGICQLEFDKNSENYYRLECGHSYHYLCIDKCFRTINSKQQYNQINTHLQYFNRRECPYCRKISGLLPIKMGVKYISGIHRKTRLKTPKVTKKRCIAICKNGRKCLNKGNPDKQGYCGIHAKIYLSNDTDTDTV